MGTALLRNAPVFPSALRFRAASSTASKFWDPESGCEAEGQSIAGGSDHTPRECAYANPRFMGKIPPNICRKTPQPLDARVTVTRHFLYRYASRSILQGRVDSGVDCPLEGFEIASVLLSQEPLSNETVDLRYM
jgi:hypothetical protein